MFWSTGCERLEIEEISYQDQDRSAVLEPQKGIGINRQLLWPAKSTGQSWAHGIYNNSRIANYRFSKFQLPGFYNGFQFTCHFEFGFFSGLICTLYHPFQHRHRFWLSFFMRFHNHASSVRLRSCNACSIVDIQKACSTSILMANKSGKNIMRI